MVDRRVFVKNIRSWYTNWDYLNKLGQAPSPFYSVDHIKTEYRHFFDGIPKIDKHNPVYIIASQAWFYGINILPLTNYSLSPPWITRSITLDKSASVVSIMPTTDVPTRKIVSRIKIACDKNLVDKNAEMLEYTILRVKQSIYSAEATHNYKTNGLRTRSLAELSSSFFMSPALIGFVTETNDLKTHENNYICNNDLQLVQRGSFFTSNEVVLDDLDYDLGLDDLVLLQKISFDKSIQASAVGKDSRGLHFRIARKEFADYRVEVEYSYGYI